MALYSKKDFADLCGVSTSNITQYVSRGKVVMTGEYIDDSISQNKYFIEKRAVKKIVIEDSEPKEVVEKKQEPKNSTLNKKHNDEVKKTATNIFGLDAIKKGLDIEKVTEEIQLLKIKKEKQLGISIPTELVKIVVKQHNVSLAMSFKNGADNLIIEISKTCDLSRTQVSEIRKQLTNVINIALDDSIDASLKSIKQIVNEYSEKKEVGERE